MPFRRPVLLIAWRVPLSAVDSPVCVSVYLGDCRLVVEGWLVMHDDPNGRAGRHSSKRLTLGVRSMLDLQRFITETWPDELSCKWYVWCVRARLCKTPGFPAVGWWARAFVVRFVRLCAGPLFSM